MNGWPSGLAFKSLFVTGVGKLEAGAPSGTSWTWAEFQRAYERVRKELLATRGETLPSFPVDADTPKRWINGESRIQPRYRPGVLAVFYGSNKGREATPPTLLTAWENDDRLGPAQATPAGAVGTSETGIASSTPPDQLHFTSLDSSWVGRVDRVAELSRRLNEKCRLLVIVGMPGIGKTALGERVSLEVLRSTPERASYYQENFDNESLSLHFLATATRWLEAWGDTPSDDERMDARRLIERLIHNLGCTRRLIQIDSFESILQGKEGGGCTFSDANWRHFFSAFLKSAQYSSVIIVTSQSLPSELEALGTRVQTAWHFEPLDGLDPDESRALFAKAKVIVEDDDMKSCLDRIGSAYQGHPLALRVIAGEIRTAPYFGSVGAYWKTFGTEIEEIERANTSAALGQIAGHDPWQIDRFTRGLKTHVRSRLDEALVRLRRQSEHAYVMLCEASIYRKPVTELFWINHLSDHSLSSEAQFAVLEIVKDRFLADPVIVDGGRALKMHNLVRSVALDHLRTLGEA